jgi:membrane protein
LKAADLTTALVQGVAEIVRSPEMQKANARSYCYFVMSVCAALISLLTLAAYFPASVLFRTVAWTGHFFRDGAVGPVRRELPAVVALHKGRILSLGILGFFWAASSGFFAMIEALDMAYDVGDDRSFWKTRSLALASTFLTGGLLLVALGLTLVGPAFGGWIVNRLQLSQVLVLMWPYFRWSVAVGLTLVAVGALYLVGPNVKQRFSAIPPGLIVSVGCWLGLSSLLEISVRYFATFNKTFEIIGVIVALLLWLYWAGLALLVGARVTAEVAKLSNEGKVAEKHEGSGIIKLNLAV